MEDLCPFIRAINHAALEPGGLCPAFRCDFRAPRLAQLLPSSSPGSMLVGQQTRSSYAAITNRQQRAFHNDRARPLPAHQPRKFWLELQPRILGGEDIVAEALEIRLRVQVSADR